MAAPRNFISSFLTTALWSSIDDDGEALDARYDISDFAPETRAKLEADCHAFYDANAAAINCLGAPVASDGTGCDGMAGHDFWLTRCRHGAGFWDGDWPEPHATKLTEAAKAFDNVDLYVGDDGRIHA